MAESLRVQKGKRKEKRMCEICRSGDTGVIDDVGQEGDRKGSEEKKKERIRKGSGRSCNFDH